LILVIRKRYPRAASSSTWPGGTIRLRNSYSSSIRRRTMRMGLSLGTIIIIIIVLVIIF
jgi:hypothetical protein